MTAYYEHREMSMENQNVMIDGERFDYSPAFRAATENANKVKSSLQRIYQKTTSA